MSVDWRLSFLLIQKFQKWDRNVRENLKVLSNSHSQTAAASVSCELSFIRHLGVTQFHKLASHGWHTDWHQQLLPNDTSPVLLLSLISERRAKFSTADFPRGETHFLYKAQCEFRWYFLGSQSLWIQVRISPEAVPGSHFYWVYSPWTWTGFTGRTTMQFSCVFLCVHSHTHKNQGWTWNMISESHHLLLLSLTNVI